MPAFPIRNPKFRVLSGRRDRRTGLCPFIAIAVALLTSLGCQPKPATTNARQSQQDRLRQFDRSDALLKAAANQLIDLPSAVDTELRPPVVILDSTKIPERQDVLAVCLANPNVPGNPNNVIRVPAGNGHFKGLRVQSGDILKYYVLEDYDSAVVGFSRKLAMDLKVAQVIDDNTLWIEGGLNQQVEIPHKIEIWRNVDIRQREIIEKLGLYADRRLPPLGWEPAPDEPALVQVLAWLNQWIRQADPPTSWKRDPLIDTLDAKLIETLEAELTNARLKPCLSAEGLAAKSLQAHEGRLLQEAVWLRDISRWAHGDDFNDVARAAALFDWTVRNIQLVDDQSTAAHRPWHILLYGRGTAAQRAWVFARLCRQQGLSVVMLGVPTADSAGKKLGDASSRRWLAALVAGGELYLFDPTLGLPIAGPDGKGVATLAQAIKDDALLRALDLDGEPYPVTSGQLQDAKAYVVADPFELSRRAGQLESALTGEDHLALSVHASDTAAKLKDLDGVGGVALWDVPYLTLLSQLTLGKSERHREALAFEPFAVRPLLWKARTRHFQGRRSAATEPGGEALNDHLEAIRHYMGVRKSDRKISQSPSLDERRVESSAKLHATYCVGLLSFDDGKFEVAADWFSNADLGAKSSPLRAGARYNLARSLEAQDKLKEAIGLLEQGDSPQQHGNALRARELASRPAAEDAEKPEK
jgi:hypothetical protein